MAGSSSLFLSSFGRAFAAMCKVKAGPVQYSPATQLLPFAVLPRSAVYEDTAGSATSGIFFFIKICLQMTGSKGQDGKALSQ